MLQLSGPNTNSWLHMSGWPLTWKSQGIPKWSGKMEKVRGSEIRCVFSSSKYSKTRFSAGAAPDSAGRAYDAPPDPLVGWGHPIPFPQLLQSQLLNNWLSGLTLFLINMKQRLLTISVNTRYQVIFACLYWKSQGKIREFLVVWKVVTLICTLLINLNLPHAL